MCESSLKLQIETMSNILHILYSEHKVKTKVIVSMIVQIHAKVLHIHYFFKSLLFSF